MSTQYFRPQVNKHNLNVIFYQDLAHLFLLPLNAGEFYTGDQIGNRI